MEVPLRPHEHTVEVHGSEPFQTQFGWHILEVLDRRTYDNTEEVKELNCVNQVRNSKLADEAELWVRRIRDEAYVEKRI